MHVIKLNLSITVVIKVYIPICKVKEFSAQALSFIIEVLLYFSGVHRNTDSHEFNTKYFLCSSNDVI